MKESVSIKKIEKLASNRLLACILSGAEKIKGKEKLEKEFNKDIYLENPDGYSFFNFTHFWEKMGILEDYLIPFQLGLEVNLNYLYEYGYLIQNSANLSEAFDFSQLYEKFVDDVVTFQYNQNTNELQIYSNSWNAALFVLGTVVNNISATFEMVESYRYFKALEIYEIPEEVSKQLSTFLNCQVSQNPHFSVCKFHDFAGKMKNDKFDPVLKEMMIKKLENFREADDDNILASLKASIMQLMSKSEKITIESLSKSMAVSVRTIQRKLSIMDITWTKLVSKIRVNLADEKLRYTNMTIREIAFSLGFSDAASFSAFFKKITGKSPSEYRKLKSI